MAKDNPKAGAHRSQFRDARPAVILWTPTKVTDAGPIPSWNNGIWFPNPDSQNELFPEDFWCTQIHINGTQNVHWQLQTNLSQTGTPTNLTKVLYGGYVATTGASLPMTVNLYMKENTRTKLLADGDLGGVGAAGNWRVWLCGYYSTQRVAGNRKV